MSPTGSFSRDPIGYEGSEWNLYEHVEGMPLIGLDPSGMTLITQCEDDCARRFPNWYQSHLFAGCVSGCNNNRTVTCWWDCMVETNKCVTTQICNIAACTCTVAFTHLEVGKGPVRRGLGTPRDVTTLQSKLALWLRNRPYCGYIHNLARRGAQQVSANIGGSCAKSCVAGVAVVEAVVSINCGYQCSP